MSKREANNPLERKERAKSNEQTQETNNIKIKRQIILKRDNDIYSKQGGRDNSTITSVSAKE